MVGAQEPEPSERGLPPSFRKGGQYSIDFRH
jgi:hypothetical protein